MMARKPISEPTLAQSSADAVALSATAPDAVLRAALNTDPGMAERLYPAVERAYQAARLKSSGAEPRLVDDVFVDDWKMLDSRMDQMRAALRNTAAVMEDWQIPQARKAQASLYRLRDVLEAIEVFGGYTPKLPPRLAAVPTSVAAHRLQGSGEHLWDAQQRIEREKEAAA